MNAAKPEVVEITTWFFGLFIVSVLIVMVRIFILETFHIPSGSMKPTLKVGDHILVDKLSSRFREVEPEGLYVFKYPLDPGRDYIKRVIARGGDVVEIFQGQVYVNGRKLNEEYINHRAVDDFGPVQVPKDHLFVLGDNRNNSEDSRYWGFVPRENIVGRAILVYWPPERVRLLK